LGLAEVTWGAPDGEVLDFAEGRIASREKPLLFYIITMSSHEPFTLVRPFYRNKDFDGIENESTRDYFTVMSYVDRELERFVAGVRKARPNTFMFIFADHTPVLQRGIYKRASFMGDGAVFEFVPCIIVAPDSRAYRETSRAASFIDVAPQASPTRSGRPGPTSSSSRSQTESSATGAAFIRGRSCTGG
jgi:lipoteichoic acid synthase